MVVIMGIASIQYQSKLKGVSFDQVVDTAIKEGFMESLYSRLELTLEKAQHVHFDIDEQNSKCGAASRCSQLTFGTQLSSAPHHSI